MAQSDVTFIVTCSFVPSHPTTSFIRATLRSLHRFAKSDNGCACLLVHQDTDDPTYLAYMGQLLEEVQHIRSVQIRVCPSPISSRVALMKTALKEVQTPYIFVVDHSQVITADINLYDVIEDMKRNPALKHIRFNARENIPGERDVGPRFGGVVEGVNCTYLHTPSWRGHPHLSTAQYYRDVVLRVSHIRHSMEHTMDSLGVGTSLPHIHDTYIFGALGDAPRSRCTDLTRYVPLSCDVRGTDRALLDHVLTKKKHVLEYGCGGSTVHMADLPQLHSIYSVETSTEWCAKVARDKIIGNAKGRGVDIRLIHVNVGPVGDWGYPLDPKKQNLWKTYSDVSSYLTPEERSHIDVVLIDGRFRVACAAAVFLMCKNPTLTVMIHDFVNRAYYHTPVLQLYDIVHTAKTLTVLTPKPLQTAHLATSVLDSFMLDPR